MDYNTLTRILLWVLEISFCAELTPLCPVYQTTVYTLLLHSDTVRKIFIKTVFVVNSNDFSCVLLIGQASCAYNKYGTWNWLTAWRTVSSEENLPILLEAALNARRCTIKLRCSMIISTLKLSNGLAHTQSRSYFKTWNCHSCTVACVSHWKKWENKM